ncbi:hypothetical protein [Oleidesulfovibrio sp.]|uniref:hypothetical protein n=1 Tax=Oleidesulfovibrio sp. TaxID=2909707 RepID=UPI003A83EF00
MFEEMLTPFMVFMLLCFVGLMVMFFFMLRGLDDLSRSLRSERSAMLDQLRSIEERLDVLNALARRHVGGAQPDKLQRTSRRVATSLDAPRLPEKQDRTDQDDNITEFILHE